MLRELSIRNFAIIDDISVSFQEGLTVLTGETGAGKSIIIDAVQLLTGGRGSIDFVRHGKKQAEISGIYFIEEQSNEIHEKCRNYDIDIEEATVVLERIITNKGKSICRINGKIVTLAVLREFGQTLINIHSQHDTTQLMDRKNHLSLLDAYQFEKISPLKEEYDREYRTYQSILKQYKRLSENDQEINQRIDLLTFQLSELQEAALHENEDRLLEEERSQLQNFEKVHRALNASYYALYGEAKGLEWVDVAQQELQEATDVNEAIKYAAEELTNIYYQLEEVSFHLRNQKESLYFDENRLNDIEARMSEIQRLQKKYGPTVDEMLQYQEDIAEELHTLQHKDSHIEELEGKLVEHKRVVLTKAEQLHEARVTIAQELETAIQIELKDLYLENATFSVHFEEMENIEPTADGTDMVSFLLSTNVGEPLKQLSKIASGGELSRIMLALKKMFAKHDQIPTVVFDEIDTGVSGRVAQAIAEKMYQISMTTQVLCITHLPQVAAMADDHMLIRKEESEAHTATEIDVLNKTEKVEELGKMLTGATLTKTAVEHSEQMLALTDAFKADRNN